MSRRNLIYGLFTIIGLSIALTPLLSQGNDYTWTLPPGFPVPKVPDDNPMTAEKVELGHHLFYDVRLSGNQAQACASCHKPELAFSDGLTVPLGSTGERLHRNSMSLTNVAYNATFTWAHPELTTLEQQIPIPMFGEFPVELGITGNENEILARFREDVQYGMLFAVAYPDQADPYNYDNIIHALASFVRTLISGNSAYDRYVYQQDSDALSEAAKRGMKLFFSETLECHHCHGGFNFTLSSVSENTTFPERPFFNTGLYNLDGYGAYPFGNRGVYEISGDLEDMGRFRPPTLRNIALTSPYMHDGSIATLEEVIQFYEDGGRVIVESEFAGDGRASPLKSGFITGFTINEEETRDLIAFLISLTDEQFMTDNRFSDPFAK